MSRLAGLAILFVGIAVFAALCYVQSDSDNDEATPTPAALSEMSETLRAALPASSEVEAAFGLHEESYVKGGSFGFIEESSGTNGLVGASWTSYNSSWLEFEPGPDEPFGLIISIAVYEDEASAENALRTGPDMFRSLENTFLACVGPGGFALAEASGTWKANCDDSAGNIGVGVVRRQRFVLFVIGRYGLKEDYASTLSSVSESVAETIDFHAISASAR